MKDTYADRGSVNLESPAGSVPVEKQFVGSFPVEAFDATSPSGASPRVRVRAGWSFETQAGSKLNFFGNTSIAGASLADADVLTVYDASEEAYRRVTLANLKTYLGV